MSEHTPAPWAIQYGGTEDSDGFCIIGKNAVTGSDVVAECWPVNAVAVGRKRLAANARLIAAAPELLAELEKVEWSGWHKYKETSMCPSCKWLRRSQHHGPDCTLNAALKKAKGTV